MMRPALHVIVDVSYSTLEARTAKCDVWSIKDLGDPITNNLLDYSCYRIWLTSDLDSRFQQRRRAVA